jgi:hypothetical protein
VKKVGEWLGSLPKVGEEPENLRKVYLVSRLE